MNNLGPILNYMKPMKEQTFQTEEYVSSPPALFIVAEDGGTFTLANDISIDGPHGEYCFSVLLNGRSTGEKASRIERRSGKVRIFTSSGWKRWSGRSFI